MKRLFKKYNRACRAAFMLLAVYSVHLFSFYALIAGSSSFFYSETDENAQHGKPKPIKHTDSLLLLVKHEVVKKVEIGNELAFVPQKATPLLVSHKLAVQGVKTNPHRMPDDTYKLYRLLRTLLI